MGVLFMMAFCVCLLFWTVGDTVPYNHSGAAQIKLNIKNFY